MPIDTDKFSEQMRSRSVDLANNRIRIANLIGTEQEKDLTRPPNCRGFGRIRHFRRHRDGGWPNDPLPIDPAAYRLGIPFEDLVRAQVFQIASCNWRCWYCYVPFNLLSANHKHSAWLTIDELLDFYQAEQDAPRIIDLTGGQPDLVPEWIPWMMKGLRRRGLDEQVYLWSDDNLSTDYFWRCLSTDDITLIRGYRNYGRVCCFKGFNAASFSFNTGAAPDDFHLQFDLFKKYHTLGIDLYGYATFTTPLDANIADDMSRFCDRLQTISENLPLRLVPLEIATFTPMQNRLQTTHHTAMTLQYTAIECWKSELQKRFSPHLRAHPIHEIVI